MIGVLPLLALLVLFGGDAALQLIFLSTICTFGIGGFFWVGLAMLFGAVLQLLVPALQARPRRKPPLLQAILAWILRSPGARRRCRSCW